MSVITINNMIIVGRVSKLCAVAVNLHLPVCLFVWTCATQTVCTLPYRPICTCGNVQIYVQFCVLLQCLDICLSGRLPDTPCVLFHTCTCGTDICAVVCCVLLTSLDICHTLSVYTHCTSCVVNVFATCSCISLCVDIYHTE